MSHVFAVNILVYFLFIPRFKTHNLFLLQLAKLYCINVVNYFFFVLCVCASLCVCFYCFTIGGSEEKCGVYLLLHAIAL